MPFNPSLVEYSASPDRQSIGFQATGETRLTKVHLNQPAIIEANGRVYTVIVESIGAAPADRLYVYADFMVTWDESG